MRRENPSRDIKLLATGADDDAKYEVVLTSKAVNFIKELL